MRSELGAASGPGQRPFSNHMIHLAKFCRDEMTMELSPVRPSSELPPRAPLHEPVNCAGSVGDTVKFLGSAEGRRAHKFWSQGILTNARVLRDYGAEVLEAFEATTMMVV